MTVEFREVPPSKAGRQSDKWKTIVAELMDNPGKAGYVGNWSPGVATQIRYGMYPAFLLGRRFEDDEQKKAYMRNSFLVETRKTEPGRADVWITYIGDYRK